MIAFDDIYIYDLNYYYYYYEKKKKKKKKEDNNNTAKHFSAALPKSF